MEKVTAKKAVRKTVKKPSTKAVVAVEKKEITHGIDVNPEMLIAKAIDKNLPIETMEKLLSMRRELKAEFARDEYFRSLSEFQADCPVIKKEKPVYNKDKKTIRFYYAPLDDIVDQVKDILQRHGFSYTIKTRQDENSVTAICRSHHICGHTEETEFTVPVMRSDFMNHTQCVATALTYAKRYAFCDAFGIMTSDPDNDAAVIGAQIDQGEIDEKINSLSENIKEGFKILGYGKSAATLFCEKFGWDNKTILLEINKIVDAKNARV